MDVKVKTVINKWMVKDYRVGLVSVIIPTYNRERFLYDAMNSVWIQAYRPIELIIIDDGSVDNTEQLVIEWGKIHSSDTMFTLSYFQQSNGGVSSARNLGLIKSCGEFIQFLDSDDELKPDKITKHVEILKLNPGIDYIYSPGGSCKWKKDIISFRQSNEKRRRLKIYYSV